MIQKIWVKLALLLEEMQDDDDHDDISDTARQNEAVSPVLPCERYGSSECQTRLNES